ncbi:DNA replication protein DnaC [Candidatus Pantoea edessiphila]|uniref:Replicative helicase loader DnaC n=1 Tax=Candidatus Pantoea edessiphila TaxID=2044610 RepID=A0A2P5SX98_9GAMM|nr:DNA replication protein DnaC [Candidatus Pantoea edessiphila]MBK4775843.1 DNA replication protein DnaC [Pantoea sp. Edef]PPI86968.1 DNA replication protein DnaC [Candidatus Pantoea edessiphila]
MKTINDLLSRLKQIIPTGTKPKFTRGEDLLAWNQEEGLLNSSVIVRENKAMKMQRIMCRSGIRELHINCSFDNYNIENEGQRKAVSLARQYSIEFDGSIASFVFSGRPGTGKNHLAAAIGNDLILRGKSVLIVTVADLMSSMKATFNETSEITEEQLIKNLSNVDLLIIDEIGIQSESRYEKMIINQIIDRRSSSKKPTGMLSNLDHNSMNILLGERVMDRMRLGKSMWIYFDWESYRSRIQGNEY